MPRPLPCAQREKIASLPLPRSKARLRLLSVRFISSHLSQSLAGGDRPGFSGTGRVWRVGKVSLAGDIHPGLCGLTATKRGENLTLVWQGLGWAAQRNPAPRGVGRGSPGCGVHPELILCWVSEVLGHLCPPGLCAGGTWWGHPAVSRVSPARAAGVAVNHDRVSASSSVCACSSQLIRHD